ncbi:hypothetical protein CCR75_009833 [Bremia lactucae]|uniref:RxLR effector protein n=1 Tax=Bremia lactucae TaxID=4779 RepID=A0A976IKL6_BRELC|nr:hypothetical protein CCR75_009833 [Bremia lactucae]
MVRMLLISSIFVSAISLGDSSAFLVAANIEQEMRDTIPVAPVARYLKAGELRKSAKSEERMFSSSKLFKFSKEDEKLFQEAAKEITDTASTAKGATSKSETVKREIDPVEKTMAAKRRKRADARKRIDLENGMEKLNTDDN